MAAEPDNGVQVLTPVGRVGQASAHLLAAAISEALERTPRLVIDFASVDYISSAGLAVLDDAVSRVAERGGVLVLSTVSEPVRIALDLAGLLPQVPLEPSRERAVARALNV
jgi:anti-anti-sigma factor